MLYRTSSLGFTINLKWKSFVIAKLNCNLLETFVVGRYMAKGYYLKSFVVSLDGMLPGVQVTTGLGFFRHLSHLSDSKDSDSLL